MSRRAKFVKGPPITSMVAVVALLERGQWFFLFGRPITPKWLINMSLGTLGCFVRNGRLCIALPNPEK